MDDFEVISISNDYSEIDWVHYGMLPSQWPFQQSNGKLKLRHINFLRDNERHCNSIVEEVQQ